MTRRISVLNQKGGVGKTTTAVNVAVCLAQKKLRVLLIDLDAQRNATQFVGLDESSAATGSAEFILNGTFEPCREVLLSGLDVIPAMPDHALLERELLNDYARGATRFNRALARISSEYDYVITDCAPTLGAQATNAVIACPEVLIPVELAHAAVMGVITMRKFLEPLTEDHPQIRVMGVLPTFADEREKTPRELLAGLREALGPQVFTTVIHTSAAIRDAAGSGRPVVLDDPDSRGAREYQSLTQEVIARAVP